MGFALRRFLREYSNAVEKGDDNICFALFEGGIPGSGKDHIYEFGIGPAVTSFLDALRIERKGIPQLKYVAWDRTEELLYYEGIIDTPVGIPYTKKELTAVMDSMNERISEALDVPGGIVAVNAPGAIELNLHGEAWLTSEYKIYGDQMPDMIRKKSGPFSRLGKRKVVILNAGIIPGPWLLVELYYRFGMMSSGFMKQIVTKVNDNGEKVNEKDILAKANGINQLFYKPDFHTVGELSDFLLRRGGSPYQVYEAQKIAWSLLDDHFPNFARRPLPEDIQYQVPLIAGILGTNPEWIEEYTRRALGLSDIYAGNMHLEEPGSYLQPDYAFLVFNNPFVNIPPETSYLLTEYIAGLRQKEREYLNNLGMGSN